MEMKYIESNAELRQLHSAGKGLIYNDFSGKGSGGKNYNVLHAASCRWVARSNVKVPKIFFGDIDEAIEWLRKNRGEGGRNWKRCATCEAKARPEISVSPESKRLEAAKRVPARRREPFTEAEAEKILLRYLKDRGYKARRQVRVASGLIDIVADGPDGRWVIEVKGEDKGGYTSAEMNFEIGVGQIVSRMTDTEVSYALAFPTSSDFRRVLRKYQGSVGFERLSLYFFVIFRNGKVEKHDALTMKNLIERM
ncbi:MAG: hypothetical protein OEZ29_00475 [Candidatus Bathyarchaeota archaeon]|nr:hypothetical protein [Candidatus Bathyarchaeota archaeon]